MSNNPLPLSEIEHVVGQSFTSSHGLKIAKSEQAKWLVDLYHDINSRAGINGWLNGHPWVPKGKKAAEVNRFMFKLKRENWFYEFRFDQESDQLEHFDRKQRYPSVFVSETSEIDNFIEHLKPVYARNVLRRARSEKVNNLKEFGMRAQLLELAAEHDFEFKLAHDEVTVRLSIRLPERKSGYHFAFRVENFDGMIAGLPDTIRELERLEKLSVSFRADNIPWRKRLSGWLP